MERTSLRFFAANAQASEPSSSRTDSASRHNGGDSYRPRLASVRWWAEDAPAWLASAMLHLAALVLLALLALRVADDPPISLTAGVAEAPGAELTPSALEFSAEDLLADAPRVEEFEPTPTELPTLAMDVPTPVVEVGLTASADRPAVAAGPALSGRDGSRKAALLQALGGTAQTEEAVLDGLRWLARKQLNDGSWSLEGPYSGGGDFENREAATAMALIAYQGAGKLPSSPRSDFGKQVADGWRWLLRQQNQDGSFWKGRGFNHAFYTDALCTIALCELLAMTGDDQYREPAKRAVQHLVRSQGDLGGWKYTPAAQSDLSVTGWVLMALKSGELAGIEVPSEVFARVSEFLDAVQRKDPPAGSPMGSRYVYEESYQFNREKIPTMTAVGLLCREYLGWTGKDPRLDKGLDFLLTHRPEWRTGKADLYYWYYATQACLHAGGRQWPLWNQVIRELLPAQQVKRGPERGSWAPPPGVSHQELGGRLYSTCLAIYTLEVYYRHLPLYQQRAVR